MAVDGKAALTFESFELGKKSKDFGDFLDARVIFANQNKPCAFHFFTEK